MNEKLENLLRLALQTSEEERAQTEELNVGFDSLTRTWELIVKYNGSLDELESYGIQVEYLIAGYAILTVPELLVEAMAEVEQIEYVEKPKRYFYGVEAGVAPGFANNRQLPTQGSCLEPVTFREPNLTGDGVLVAVLDSGIDYSLPEFRNADGSTRILYLWDQTLVPGDLESVSENVINGTDNETMADPPQGFKQGVEFTAEQINLALQAASQQERFQLLPSIDTSGHGTAVAGIAAGNSANYRGVAPEARLLVVKLGQPEESSFPRTTEIMRAITYSLNKARELSMPLVINLSFGNTYGAHDGSSLLERFLDNAAEIGRTVICVGSGNEGNNSGHYSGRLVSGNGILQPATVELSVGEYESSLSVQLWKNYKDTFEVTLRSPGGQESVLPETVNGGKYTLQLEQTRILVYLGEPTPYAVAQEIYLELIPASGNYINRGIWTITLRATGMMAGGGNRTGTGADSSGSFGNYYLYLPSGVVRSGNTGFFRPTPDVTLTIPATASKVITVGAYDSVYDSYADFSGRGYADVYRTVGVVAAGLTKPDIVAPGVNILAPDRYGRYAPVTGTSFATPIVSGSVALMMEWGLVRGNDLFLYGEKAKAYLRRGAQPLRGETAYPNERVGWGKLCLAESLPI